MRKQVADFLLSGVVFCAVRFVDLALWTDLETGLVKGGHVWLRYAALFVWVLAALATGHNSAGPAALLAAPLSRKSAVALSVPAFAAGTLYLAQGVLDLLAGGILRGALHILCALWLEVLAQRWLAAGLRRKTCAGSCLRRGTKAPPHAAAGEGRKAADPETGAVNTPPATDTEKKSRRER